jgi:hypothetical protein
MAGKAPSAFGASAGAPEPESSSADNSNASTQNYGVVLDPFLGEESSARLPLGYEGSSQLSADINSMTFWSTATGISPYLDTVRLNEHLLFVCDYSHLPEYRALGTGNTKKCTPLDSRKLKLKPTYGNKIIANTV